MLFSQTGGSRTHAAALPMRPIQNISTQFPRRSIDLRGRRNGVFLWPFVPASASPPFQTVRMTVPPARWRVWAPAPPPQPSPISTSCSGGRSPGSKRRHSALGRNVQPLLVSPGFRCLFLVGMVIAFPDRNWYGCSWQHHQNYEEDNQNDEIRTPPRAGEAAPADHH